MDALLKEINAHSTETKRRLTAVRGSQSDEWERKQRREGRRIGFEALQNSSILKNAANSTLITLSKRFKPIKYRAGEYIIEQGKIGHRFFVIISGSVGVYANKVKVATLTRGKIMGERSLIRDDQTSASCVAEMETMCVYIGRESFHEVFGEDDIEQFEQAIAKQDLLSHGNARDYSYMDAAMQQRVMSQIGKLKNKFSRRKNHKSFSIIERQKRSKFFWAILRNHVKTKIALRTSAFKGLPESEVGALMSSTKT